MTYDNRNKGTIGKNTRKTEDTHPDIAGQINVEGVEYWINGWQKTNSKDGTKFYSLSVKMKDGDRPVRPQTPAASVWGDRPDDDIPF